jgi:hypothetical protein
VTIIITITEYGKTNQLEIIFTLGCMVKEMNKKMCQFKYEASSWKRILEFIKQENIQVKNHLAEVVRFSDADEFSLNDVEFILNNLLQIEAGVRLIITDVQVFEKLIDKEIYVDGSYLNLIHKRQMIIKDLKNIEVQFKNMQSQADSFLYNTLLSSE